MSYGETFTSPGMTVLAVTLAWLIIVPPLVAIYRPARRIQQAQHLAGVEPMNGWIAPALYLVLSPVSSTPERPIA